MLNLPSNQNTPQSPSKKINTKEHDEHIIQAYEEEAEQHRQIIVEELAELVSHGIGTKDSVSQVFFRGQQTLESLKRLEYLLRNDARQTDQQRIVFRKLASQKTLQNSIIPLFCSSNNDSLIVDSCVKIFCRLTMPIESILSNLDTNNDVNKTINLQTEPQFLEFNSDYLRNLQSYKQLLLEGNTLAFIMQQLQQPLSSDTNDRSEIDSDQIELYLTLFRNILAIPNMGEHVKLSNLNTSSSNLNSTKSRLVDDRAFVHDRAILAFCKEHIMTAVLMLAQQAQNESNTVVILLLQILYHFFRLENGADFLLLTENNCHKNSNISSSANANTQIYRDSSSKLSKLRKSEKQKLNRLTSHFSNRRRQGARYAVKMDNGSVHLTKHVASGDCVNGDGLEEDAEFMFNTSYSGYKSTFDWGFSNKQRQKIVPDNVSSRHQYFNDEVRQCLVNVMKSFLEVGYNSLMEACLDFFRDDITLDFHSEYYHQFCFLSSLSMQFYRLNAQLSIFNQTDLNASLIEVSNLNSNLKNYFDDDCISATINSNAFTFVNERIKSIFEFKEIRYAKINWQQLEDAFRMFKEMIRIFHEMIFFGKTEEIVLKAKTLLSNFFDREKAYFSILPNLLKDFQSKNCSRRYLSNLIEVVHYILRILHYSNSENVGEDQKGEMNDNEHNLDESDKSSWWESDAMDFNSRKLSIKIGFEEYVRCFAHNKILYNYLVLLDWRCRSNFDEHVSQTTTASNIDHYILSHFRRIAFDLKLEPVFYQLSIFNLFKNIFDIGKNSCESVNNRCLSDLIKFCKHILRGFFEKANKNSMMYMEILFWKTQSLINDIHNFDVYGNNFIRKRSSKENNSQLVEQLAQEHEEDRRRGQDSQDDFSSERKETDINARSLENVSDEEWTAEAEIGDLSKSFRQTAKQDEILIRKYEEYKDDEMCCAYLATFVEPHTEFQVKKRLKKLGLLSKKRVKKKLKNSNISQKENFNEMDAQLNDVVDENTFLDKNIAGKATKSQINRISNTSPDRLNKTNHFSKRRRLRKTILEDDDESN